MLSKSLRKTEKLIVIAEIRTRVNRNKTVYLKLSNSLSIGPPEVQVSKLFLMLRYLGDQMHVDYIHPQNGPYQ